MLINFDVIEEIEHIGFKGGEGVFAVRGSGDTACKIMRSRLVPGASLGWHVHNDSCEIIYVFSGQGVVRLEEGEEALVPGSCHYCPKGVGHQLINNGEEDLVILAIVPQQ